MFFLLADKLIRSLNTKSNEIKKQIKVYIPHDETLRSNLETQCKHSPSVTIQGEMPPEAIHLSSKVTARPITCEPVSIRMLVTVRTMSASMMINIEYLIVR